MIFILSILSASHRGILVWGRGKWKQLDTINGRRWVCSPWSLPRAPSPAEWPAPWPRPNSWTCLEPQASYSTCSYQDWVHLLLGAAPVISPKNSSHFGRPRVFTVLPTIWWLPRTTLNCVNHVHMCVCVCVCVCLHACMCVCGCACTHACVGVPACMHACVCACTHACVCVGGWYPPRKW